MDDYKDIKTVCPLVYKWGWVADKFNSNEDFFCTIHTPEDLNDELLSVMGSCVGIHCSECLLCAWSAATRDFEKNKEIGRLKQNKLADWLVTLGYIITRPGFERSPSGNLRVGTTKMLE